MGDTSDYFYMGGGPSEYDLHDQYFEEDLFPQALSGHASPARAASPTPSGQSAKPEGPKKKVWAKDKVLNSHAVIEKSHQTNVQSENERRKKMLEDRARRQAGIGAHRDRFPNLQDMDRKLAREGFVTVTKALAETGFHPVIPSYLS